MSKRKELLKQRETLHAAWKTLQQEAESDGWTDDRKAADDKFVADLGEIEDALAREDRRLKAIADADAPEGVPAEIPDDAAIVSAEKRWPTFGHFCTAVMEAMTPGGIRDPRLDGFVPSKQAGATGGSQGVPAEGGYPINPQFSSTIWDGLNNDPMSLYGRTDQYTIEGESLTFHANAETSRANGSRYGGVLGYWIAEADQITKSKPKFRDLRLEPRELAVLIYQTDKSLRRNPMALGQFVERVSREEIMFLIGDAIVNGDGAKKPLGLLNSPSLITVSKETGQSAATVVAENISKMYARLHPRMRDGAVWLYNVEIEPQLDQLNYAIGTSGQLVYMPPGGLREEPMAMLKGKPMIPIEYCAALGTLGDLILVNLGAYATGVEPGAVRQDVSMHLRFDYAEQAFRAMFAVDGQPWLASALTPFKGSDTLGSHVALATRA